MAIDQRTAHRFFREAYWLAREGVSTPLGEMLVDAVDRGVLAPVPSRNEDVSPLVRIMPGRSEDALALHGAVNGILESLTGTPVPQFARPFLRAPERNAFKDTLEQHPGTFVSQAVVDGQQVPTLVACHPQHAAAALEGLRETARACSFPIVGSDLVSNDLKRAGATIVYRNGEATVVAPTVAERNRLRGVVAQRLHDAVTPEIRAHVGDLVAQGFGGTRLSEGQAVENLDPTALLAVRDTALREAAQARRTAQLDATTTLICERAWPVVGDFLHPRRGERGRLVPFERQPPADAVRAYLERIPELDRFAQTINAALNRSYDRTANAREDAHLERDAAHGREARTRLGRRLDEARRAGADPRLLLEQEKEAIRFRDRARGQTGARDAYDRDLTLLGRAAVRAKERVGAAETYSDLHHREAIATFLDHLARAERRDPSVPFTSIVELGPIHADAAADNIPRTQTVRGKVVALVGDSGQAPATLILQDASQAGRFVAVPFASIASARVHGIRTAKTMEIGDDRSARHLAHELANVALGTERRAGRTLRTTTPILDLDALTETIELHVSDDGRSSLSMPSAYAAVHQMQERRDLERESRLDAPNIDDALEASVANAQSLLASATRESPLTLAYRRYVAPDLETTAEPEELDQDNQLTSGREEDDGALHHLEPLTLATVIDHLGPARDAAAFPRTHEVAVLSPLDIREGYPYAGHIIESNPAFTVQLCGDLLVPHATPSLGRPLEVGNYATIVHQEDGRAQATLDRTRESQAIAQAAAPYRARTEIRRDELHHLLAVQRMALAHAQLLGQEPLRAFDDRDLDPETHQRRVAAHVIASNARGDVYLAVTDDRSGNRGLFLPRREVGPLAIGDTVSVDVANKGRWETQLVSREALFDRLDRELHGERDGNSMLIEAYENAALLDIASREHIRLDDLRPFTPEPKQTVQARVAEVTSDQTYFLVDTAEGPRYVATPTFGSLDQPHPLARTAPVERPIIDDGKVASQQQDVVSFLESTANDPALRQTIHESAQAITIPEELRPALDANTVSLAFDEQGRLASVTPQDRDAPMHERIRIFSERAPRPPQVEARTAEELNQSLEERILVGTVVTERDPVTIAVPSTDHLVHLYQLFEDSPNVRLPDDLQVGDRAAIAFGHEGVTVEPLSVNQAGDRASERELSCEADTSAPRKQDAGREGL